MRFVIKSSNTAIDLLVKNIWNVEENVTGRNGTKTVQIVKEERERQY
jgi:hypothetical protein